MKAYQVNTRAGSYPYLVIAEEFPNAIALLSQRGIRDTITCRTA